MPRIAPLPYFRSLFSLLSRYAIAVAAVGGSITLVFFLQRTQVRDPFALIFLISIAVSFWYGKDGPGILATILSSLALSAFLHSPHGRFHIAFYDLPIFGIYFLCVFWVYGFIRSRRRMELSLDRNRKQLEAEIQIRTSELTRINVEYKTILNATPFGIALFSPGRIVRCCNPAYEEMLGFGPGELIGQRAPLPEAEEEAWSALKDQLRAGHQVVNYQAQRVRKDHSEFPATISLTPLLKSDGTYIGLVGLIIDNTEQHAQESERQMLTALVQHSPDFIGVADMSGNAVFVNRAGRRIFGLHEDEPVARINILEYFVEQERQRAAEELIPALESRRCLDFETLGRNFESKQTFPLHCTCFVIPDIRTGKPAFLASVAQDITERHQSRAALERSLKENEALLEENRRLQEQLQRENISLQERNLALQGELADIQKSKFEEIIGHSPALQRTLIRVSQVAHTDSTVLITGETGTGKELIAQAIHKNSRRARLPFRSVNCAALPATLIAAELFGHEKGAFTGADRLRIGQFELAAGGTLFLDEIGEIPIDMQATLLRVLEEHSFERLGGNKPIPANVRIIAATNRDLYSAMQGGTFRQDLFYRLNQFPIEVPPLRQRRDDIPELVSYFARISSKRHGKSILNIEKREMELLRSYSWPGNIRELRNVIDTSVIISSGERLSIDEELLFAARPMDDAPIGSLQKNMENHERMLIERALTETQGRVYGPSGAAAILHLPPSTLSAKIKVLEINLSKFKSR